MRGKQTDHYGPPPGKLVSAKHASLVPLAHKKVVDLGEGGKGFYLPPPLHWHPYCDKCPKHHLDTCVKKKKMKENGQMWNVHLTRCLCTGVRAQGGGYTRRSTSLRTRGSTPPPVPGVRHGRRGDPNFGQNAIHVAPAAARGRRLPPKGTAGA